MGESWSGLDHLGCSTRRCTTINSSKRTRSWRIENLLEDISVFLQDSGKIANRESVIRSQGSGRSEIDILVLIAGYGSWWTSRRSGRSPLRVVYGSTFCDFPVVDTVLPRGINSQMFVRIDIPGINLDVVLFLRYRSRGL